MVEKERTRYAKVVYFDRIRMKREGNLIFNRELRLNVVTKQRIGAPSFSF